MKTYTQNLNIIGGKLKKLRIIQKTKIKKGKANRVLYCDQQIYPFV